MKTFLSVSLGLVAGFILGAFVTFKAAEKKYSAMAEEEIAEERRNSREHHCCENCPCDTADNIDISETEEKKEDHIVENIPDDFKEVDEEYEELSGAYTPKKKPYIWEEQPIGWEEKHPFVHQFKEVLVVYDKDKGRCADEDGCEIFNIQGLLGWNNLNKLYTDDFFVRDNTMRIVDEQNGMVYHVHAGRLSEYMEDKEEEIGYDED
jgi:hypothetical protein